MIERITEDQFEEKVYQASGPVVVDFYSRHCMPCKKMEPIVEEVAEELAGQLQFYKMEVNDNYILSRDIGISSFPTCILFHNGKVVYRVIGPRTKEAFIDELDLESL